MAHIFLKKSNMVTIVGNINQTIFLRLHSGPFSEQTTPHKIAPYIILFSCPTTSVSVALTTLQSRVM